MTTNEEIAELLGWKLEEMTSSTVYPRLWKSPKGEWEIYVPDYLHSLDLVHDDLESVLVGEEPFEYADEIASLVQHPTGDAHWDICNASAAVKCDAWAQVMRNRKDTP
jgi:hypothetical protein